MASRGNNGNLDISAIPPAPPESPIPYRGTDGVLVADPSINASRAVAARTRGSRAAQTQPGPRQGRYNNMPIEKMTQGQLIRAYIDLTAKTPQEKEALQLDRDLINTPETQLKDMVGRIIYKQATGKDPPVEVPVTQEQQDTLADLRVQIRDELQTLRNNNESVASAYVSIEAAARAFMSKLNMPVDSKKVADFTFDQLLDTYLKQAS